MATRRPRTPPRALVLLAFGVLALLPAATLPTASTTGVFAPKAAIAVDAASAASRDGFESVRSGPSRSGPSRSDPPRFDWPLPGRPDVGRPFDAPLSPFGPGHRGIDLVSPPGTPVYAAGAGVVVFAGKLAGRGVVSIDHQLLRTTYEPVKPTVTAGEQVYAGQRIGTLQRGHSGCVPACLHWGVRRGTAPPEYLNPLPLLAAHTTIRLKPWPE
ncbi:MAG: peptidoglycan DD-metalloendopeptidase family protein [Actinophytocola sp.]|nr:peptidoglycan DD-metalloendopeptidase family protein [Actinophytocola sp.]